MAVKPYFFEPRTDGALVYWPNMTNGDTGVPFEIGGYNDNTVTVTGTFDSDTLTMQGSNLVTGTADGFVSLHGPDGNVSAFAVDGSGVLAEAPDMLRPSCGGASGTTVLVAVRLRKS